MTSTRAKLFLSVNRIREVTSRIRTYELRAENGGELPLITAGSHLTIPVELGGGKAELRNYSICSNTNQRDFYEIAIPYDSNDHSGAQSIFDAISVGTQFECDLPANNFHVHADSSPAVLIAGDIGIAPIISIAHTLAARGRRFSLHYTGDSKTEMAFTNELENTFARQTQFYCSEESQHIDMMHILAEAPGNTLFYASGPRKILDDLDNGARALGISQDRIQQEYLASEKLEKDKAVVLELAYSNKLLHVKADQPLLAALRDAGVSVQFDCCVGDCGTCAVKILEGEPEHRDHVLSDAQKADGFICICVSRSKSEKLILAL